MAENQMIRPERRAAVFKRTDLPVRAAKAYLAHSEQHVSRALQLWLRHVDELEALLGRKYGYSLHTPP
jgi:hypothetical protein